MHTSLVRSCLLALLALGCGGGTAPDTSGGADASVTTCAGYSLGDACVNEDNLAECREMAERCPGAVLALESCPIQFICL